jgi:hypothetical protein
VIVIVRGGVGMKKIEKWADKNGYSHKTIHIKNTENLHIYLPNSTALKVRKTGTKLQAGILSRPGIKYKPYKNQQEILEMVEKTLT